MQRTSLVVKQKNTLSQKHLLLFHLFFFSPCFTFPCFSTPDSAHQLFTEPCTSLIIKKSWVECVRTDIFKTFCIIGANIPKLGNIVLNRQSRISFLSLLQVANKFVSEAVHKRTNSTILCPNLTAQRSLQSIYYLIKVVHGVS